MAGVPRDIYTFASGTTTFAIKLPRNYYTSIDTKLGFTKIDTSAVRGKTVFRIAEAVRSGLVIPVGILFLKGTRLTRATIYCPVDKLTTAMQELPDDTYRGFTIRSAVIKQRRRLG